MRTDSDQVDTLHPPCPEGLESLSSGICCIFGLFLMALASMALEPRLPVIRWLLACFAGPASFLLWAACFGSQALKRRLVTVLGAGVAVLGGTELVLQRLTGLPLNAPTWDSAETESGTQPEISPRQSNAAPAVSETRRSPQADVVTLATAATQGRDVGAAEVWSSQLGRMLRCSVSNIEITRFGSPHDALLLQRAMARQPRLLVVALDPITDLNVIRYGTPSGRPHVRSGLGALLRDESALGSIAWQLIRRAGLDSRQMIRIDHPTNPTLFSAESLSATAAAVDVRRDGVGRALNQTICFLQRARHACRSADCELLVLLVPSRARIYRDHLRTISHEIPTPLERTVAKELYLLRMLRDALGSNRIACTDAGKAVLQQMQWTPDVYPSWNNNQPLAAGHQAYARAVYAAAHPMLLPPEYAPPELATN